MPDVVIATVAADLGFPGRVVLPGLSWQVGAGEIVCLVGPNGSGKTTMLRTLAGTLHPRAGTVSIGGRPAADQRSRLVTGFVPDPPPLYEELSPWEHLELTQRLWGSARVPQERVDAVVTELDLEPHLHQRCDALSLGLRKRLGIALGVLHRPVLLLLDEPFNGLDATTTERLLALMAAMIRDGDAVVVSTHQPHLLAGLATRIDTIDDETLTSVPAAATTRSGR